MSKDNHYITNLVMAAFGIAFAYVGGHLLWNSGSYILPGYFYTGLGMVIFGSMIFGVAVNKLSVEYRANNGTSKKDRKSVKTKKNNK